MRTRVVCLIAAVALAGCGVRMTPPKPSSVREIKNRTLERIDRFEQSLRDNRLTRDDVAYLRGILAQL